MVRTCTNISSKGSDIFKKNNVKENKMSEWLAIGAEAGGQVVNEALNRGAEWRQFDKTKTLMDIQNKNQQKLNKQGQDIQMQMWKDTNYPAQMKMIEEAGLNPAMLYGKGGAGGATTGSQGGGSASSGQVSQGKSGGMDIMTAMQAGLLKAQKANIEADTKLKLEGADNTYQQGKGQFLNNVVKEWEMQGDSNVVRIVKSKKYGEAGMSSTSEKGKGIIASNEILSQELENLKVEETAKQAGIELTEEKTREVYHSILQRWANTGIKAIDSLDLVKLIKNIVGGKKKVVGKKKGKTTRESVDEWDGVLTD